MSNVVELPRPEPSPEMIAANRFAFVEEQIMMIRAGIAERIRCPYCLNMNEQGTEFCCSRMRKAVAVVLDKMDFEARKDQVNRIADKVN